jgi:hypothetical protein
MTASTAGGRERLATGGGVVDQPRRACSNIVLENRHTAIDRQGSRNQQTGGSIDRPATGNNLTSAGTKETGTD